MLTTDPTSWVRRCADRLHQHWQTIPREDLEDTALDLLASQELRQLTPEEAAARWLRQGVAVE